MGTSGYCACLREQVPRISEKRRRRSEAARARLGREPPSGGAAGGRKRRRGDLNRCGAGVAPRRRGGAGAAGLIDRQKVVLSHSDAPHSSVTAFEVFLQGINEGILNK